jgi:integrase/recombinase XerD
VHRECPLRDTTAVLSNFLTNRSSPSAAPRSDLREIAALTIGDVLTRDGTVRREIKLGAHQTKGSKGRTVILSGRAQRALGVYAVSRRHRGNDAPLIASQRCGRSFTSVSLSMMFKEI